MIVKMTDMITIVTMILILADTGCNFRNGYIV